MKVSVCRLDGTKLLYCLDRTKYNCMAVAELFPNGTFRAKRPHTGHLPNPEECEVKGFSKKFSRFLFIHVLQFNSEFLPVGQ